MTHFASIVFDLLSGSMSLPFLVSCISVLSMTIFFPSSWPSPMITLYQTDLDPPG